MTCYIRLGLAMFCEVSTLAVFITGMADIDTVSFSLSVKCDDNTFVYSYKHT